MALNRPDPRARCRQRVIGRFGDVDATDGGQSSRYSASVEWQRTRGAAATKITAYGLVYDLDLFSNFTYFLDDPVNGDQFQQADRRFVSGAKANHRRMAMWAGRPAQNSVGVQLRHDEIGLVGLYLYVRPTTPRDRPTGCGRADEPGRVCAERDRVGRRGCARWRGMRVDGYRFGVQASEAANSGKAYASRVSPRPAWPSDHGRGPSCGRERRARVPQQRRASRDHRRRSLDGRSCRASHAIGARHRRRGRRAHGAPEGTATYGGALDVGARVRVALCGRCGHDRGRPAPADATASSGRTTTAQRAAQRRRLLLCLTPAGRASSAGSTTSTSTRRCRAPPA